ncbi:alpha/beta hydrolase [Amycolatopsis jejuensis]|uniref:alpha/beta hydrolase n=1 Tax=Amycolatopsis jejuensis TaxID=330084 RepID=UPI00052537DA|nr:alpha/beta hydrolase [Amycolatopsis jejuensis]
MSVSEAARKFLQHPRRIMTFPPRDDVAGWLRLVEEQDAYIMESFAGVTLPVTADDTEVAGVRTYVVRGPGIPDSDQTPIYLDLHGGGLFLCGGDLCRLLASGMAMVNGMITWSPDYRMPPHHVYPAALDDCLAVYRALLEVRDPVDIFVGGGSAGGNLAAALLVRVKEEGLPMPAALVLQTPEVDLTESGDSFLTNRDFDNVCGTLREANELYAGGYDLADPRLSPLFADLRGFPPTLLQAGTRDLYLSNTVRMHRALRAAGVDAELHVFEAMPHGGFGGGTPEDLELTAEVRRFLDRHRRS